MLTADYNDTDNEVRITWSVEATTAVETAQKFISALVAEGLAETEPELFLTAKEITIIFTPSRTDDSSVLMATIDAMNVTFFKQVV